LFKEPADCVPFEAFYEGHSLKLSKCPPLFFLNGGDVVVFCITHKLTSHHLYDTNLAATWCTFRLCLAVLWSDWHEIRNML